MLTSNAKEARGVASFVLLSIGRCDGVNSPVSTITNHYPPKLRSTAEGLEGAIPARGQGVGLPSKLTPLRQVCAKRVAASD